MPNRARSRKAILMQPKKGLSVTRNLARLNAQIEKLQREAEALKAREADGVIARIKEAIAHYGLTAADLGFRKQRAAGGTFAPKQATKKARKGSRKRTASGVINSRDAAGNSWTGHGRVPNWFKAALDSGATRESMLVK